MFTNDWCIWFWKNYSIAMLLLPTVVYGALKILAIFKPSVKTDKVRELIREWFPIKGGIK